MEEEKLCSYCYNYGFKPIKIIFNGYNFNEPQYFCNKYCKNKFKEIYFLEEKLTELKVRKSVYIFDNANK